MVVGADPRGGEGRGVVAAASYEARVHGIRSAMPIGEAYRRCPEAAFIRPDGKLYARASRAVRELFRAVTPDVEVVSIDEAYLDLTGTERLHGEPRAAAEKLRRTIADRTRLPASMGLGSTKTIAKIASEFAKPNGFLHVLPGAERVFLDNLPLARMPGIGPKTRERLERANLRRVGDLVRVGPEVVGSLLGERGTELCSRAEGLDRSRVVSRDRPKSISRETTFDEDTSDIAHCEAILFRLGEHACHDLRAHGLTARTITLKLRYDDFTTVTRSVTLDAATDNDHKVGVEARRLYRQLSRRAPVRLIGVGLSNLDDVAPQGDLFATRRSRSWERLTTPIDRLRDRFGFDAVQLGTTLDLHRPRDGDSE